jgi:hypothetical protein
MAIRNTFDYSPLLAQLHRVPGDLKQPVLQAIKESANAMIAGGKRSLLANTPPANAAARGKAAKLQGEKAVSRDIAKVYGSAGKVYASISDPAKAKAFWARLKRGDIAGANAILREAGHELQMKPWDGGVAHRAARDNRGRVTADDVFYGFIAETDKLTAYRKMRLDNVGMFAASQMGGAIDLGGGSKVPAWVKRHPIKGNARWIVNERSMICVMTFDPIFRDQEVRSRLDYVRRYGQNALNRRLPFIIKSVLKKRGSSSAGRLVGV